MPTMNGKKYPYTKEGMRRYKQDKKKKGNDKKSLAQDTTKSPYMIKDGKMVLRPEYQDKKKKDDKNKKYYPPSSAIKKGDKEGPTGQKPKSSKTANKEAKAKMKQARKYLKKKDG